MDFERLERVWRSNANSPTEAAAAYLMEETMDTLKQRRQSFERFTGFIGIVLVAWAAKIIFDASMDPFPFDIRREWAAVPLLVLPWVALLLMRARFRRHLKAHPDPYVSMPATLRALIDENDTARQRMHFMALMMLLVVGLIALALSQLLEVGKMEPRHVLQGSILFGGVLAISTAGNAWIYFRKLKPEGERLKRLLADYAEA